MAVFVKPN